MEKAKRLLELNHPKTAQPKSEIEIKNSITSAAFKQEGITRSFRGHYPRIMQFIPPEVTPRLRITIVDIHLLEVAYSESSH